MTNNTNNNEPLDSSTETWRVDIDYFGEFNNDFGELNNGMV